MIQKNSKIRVCHVITSLDAAGAQVLLENVLRHVDHTVFESVVISLRDRGVLGKDIQSLGIPVHTLDMDPGRFGVSSIFKLRNLMREIRPDLIHGWLYHGILLATMGARLAQKTPVLWGIHHLRMDPDTLKWMTRGVIRTCSFLSRWLPEMSLYVTQDALDEHIRLGFSPLKTHVMRNGVDVERFTPNSDARVAFRQQLGIAEQTKVVGRVGRYTPEKDYRTFIRAAGILARRNQDMIFVMCGEGLDDNNRELAGWLKEEGIEGRCHLLGQQKEVWKIIPGFDVMVSSSFSETCPIVLCEGMACGVVCVATDVGDSAKIVGDTGQVIPSRNASRLAEAVSKVTSLTSEQYERQSIAARDRIRDEFSIRTITRHYSDVWKRVARSTSNGNGRVVPGTPLAT